MRFLILVILGLNLLQIYVNGAETKNDETQERTKRSSEISDIKPPEEISDETGKKRGWGKRLNWNDDSESSSDSQWNDLSLLNSDLYDLTEKRRGWGKRSDLLINGQDTTKRRGWGKRSDNDEVQLVDDDDFNKRRGWGKRDSSDNEKRPSNSLVNRQLSDALNDEPTEYTKRRGWGKRASNSLDNRQLSDALNDETTEYTKRRGWGKRASNSLDDRQLADALNEETTQYTKRRGWGKRAPNSLDDPQISDAFNDETTEYVKRRGWGKRAPNSLDDPQIDDALNDDTVEYSKRRGWEKRSNTDELDLPSEKKRGWGKRSQVTNDYLSNVQNQLDLKVAFEKLLSMSGHEMKYNNVADAQSLCQDLTHEIYYHVHKALEAEARRRTRQCANEMHSGNSGSSSSVY